MTAKNQPTAPSIMIVDDTPADLRLLERLLTERGYQVRPFLSSRLALHAARIEAPDLIMLDVTMPEMNGYELCVKLKADVKLKEIPVIFISALSETMDKVKAFNAGGGEFVTKPYRLVDVHARIRAHLPDVPELPVA